MRLSFDRGTLLIDEPAAAARPGSLPGVLWDPRVRRFRAPAWRYRDLQAALRNRGVPFEDGVLARPAAQPRAAWKPIELRPYQQAALLAWRGANSRAVLVLPTGSGKTRIACAAMALASSRALCLVPTRALLHQWHDEIERHYSGPVGCIGDGKRRVEDVSVTTFESAYRTMSRLGRRFELLVVDEVHHFGCAVRDEALEMCAAPLRLGLTATPCRGDPAARVEELVGPTVYETAIGDLAGRWLADFDVVVLRLRLDTEERARYEMEIAAFRKVHRRFREMELGGSWQQFVAAASRSDEGRKALAAWRQARRMLAFTRAKRETLHSLLRQHHQNKVLVFTWDNETAYQIAREHLVMPITCDISRREREQALSWFRSGQLRALVSAQVLNEGIDVPDADVAIVVGGALGEREHVQRVGRLLRPRDGKRAVVYELVTIATTETRQSARRRRGLAASASTGV
jgi:superfamily II DNA or RNA helicase